MVASSKKQRADKTECAIKNWLIIYANAGSLSQRTTTISCGIHEVHCESQFDFLEIRPSTYKCTKKARSLLCLAQVSRPPLSLGEDVDDALHKSVEIYYLGYPVTIQQDSSLSIPTYRVHILPLFRRTTTKTK